MGHSYKFVIRKDWEVFRSVASSLMRKFLPFKPENISQKVSKLRLSYLKGTFFNNLLCL